MTAGTLGCIDVVAGLVMLWAALRITSRAGFRTAEARWALCRRFVYGATSIAIFGLGVGRLQGDHPVTSTGETLFQLILLFGVVVFPLLRAFNWITQDQFKNVDGSYERRGERGR